MSRKCFKNPSLEWITMILDDFFNLFSFTPSSLTWSNNSIKSVSCFCANLTRLQRSLDAGHDWKPLMQLHGWKHNKRPFGVCVTGAAKHCGFVLIKTGDNRSSVNIMYNHIPILCCRRTQPGFHAAAGGYLDKESLMCSLPPAAFYLSVVSFCPMLLCEKLKMMWGKKNNKRNRFFNGNEWKCDLIPTKSTLFCVLTCFTFFNRAVSPDLIAVSR